MAELCLQRSGKPVATNPLQESFIKLDQADELRQQGKLNGAQAICEALVRDYPDYYGALHTLGLVCADKKNYERALDCLVRAAMLNPRSWTTLTALSGVYLRLNAPEMAAQALEQARAIKPQDPAILCTLGEIYRDEREYELAKDAFRQAVTLEDNLVPAIMGLGWMYSQLGQNAEAAAVFEGAIKRGLQSIDILLALTSLPASLVGTDVLREMDGVVCQPTGDKAEFDNTAAFVRAAALDKAGRHAEAWEHLVPANRMIFRAMQDDVKNESEWRSESLALLRRNPIRAARARDAQPISLFILGPSRSGKTTMESLVSALNDVKRGYENPSVERAIRRTFQTAGLLAGSDLGFLPPQLYPLCSDFYLEELGRRAGPAKVFTNTHPWRIHDAALMVSVFPNARFIFMKRNVEDTVLRIYQRKYRRANAYAYDLKATRDHVIWYHEMMDSFAQKLPDMVRVFDYEDLVAEPAAALRAAAELCGLPMTEKPLPRVGDDRGCAEPYRQLMADALQNG